MFTKLCIRTAKSAPYPPFPTEGDLLVKIKPSGRPELRRVTQPPHIAGPLGFKLSRPEICLQKPIDMYNNLLQRIGVKNEK